MMPSPVAHAALALLATLLASCAAAPRVEVARAPGTDFLDYDTFTFHQPLGTDREGGMRTILSQNLTRAARTELEARGYRFVDGDADLEVNFFVESKEVIEGLARRPGVDFGYGVFHRHYGVWSDYDTEVRQVTEGTLHVDVIDAAQNTLVWEGVARARGSDAEFAFEPEGVRAAVSRVFAAFPRQPAG
ncbi:MAG: DUF4136 domain-containing protein [Pseudomonadales bacterium]